MPRVRAQGPDRLDPVHPGDVLLNDFLLPLGISAHHLARETGMPASRVSAILKGERSVTADTAMRLGRYFGISPEIWTGLQAKYDLEVEGMLHGDQIAREVRPLEQTCSA